MWNGKNKALTFSFDDAVRQDKRLIEIFDRYGLKATFNLNSGLLGKEIYLEREGVRVEHFKFRPEEVKEIYKNHEVAAHTVRHKVLTTIEDDEELIRTVEEDRLALSELVGYEVVGMAYPGDGKNPSNDDRVARLIKENTGIKYSRITLPTKNFDGCDDLLRYRPTVSFHAHWNELFELGKQFIELKTDTPKIFYIWGHAYEFDIYPERWEQFEEFCKMIGGKDDIFYGTNKEVLL